MTSPERPRGRFLTLEGPEGAGKTLQAARLADALRADGHDVVLTREPGGTRLGERLRDLLLERSSVAIEPLADALLFNAARAQLIAEVVRPAIEAGRVVICTRFADSTLAYQGYGAGVAIETLRAMAEAATGGIRPDLTILLDVPPEVGLRRKAPDDHTRFEAGFDLDFHRRVRAGFLDLAAGEPGRFVVIDAQLGIEAVFEQVIEAAHAAVGEPLVPPLRMDR
ncbi:MAG: dTMP kinase [Chloroflexi bacterium]|nr:dTMP kinase [Chloroflexota bacterium]